MSKERERSREVSTGPDPFSDDFESSDGAGTGVEVIHGVHSHTLPLVGMTVRQAREELSERMHIDPDALAVVDGEEVSQEAGFRACRETDPEFRQTRRGKRSQPDSFELVRRDHIHERQNDH